MKKVVSLLLCLALAVTMFAGCDKKMTMDQIMKDTNIVVGKVGDQKIYAYEMLYLMSMNYDANAAFDEIKSVKVMLQKAIDLKITLTADDEKKVNEQLDSMIEQYGGKEAFEEILTQFGLTYDQYVAISKMSQQVSKLNEEVTKKGEFKEATDAEAKEFFDKNFIKAKHILFATVNSQTNEKISEEEMAKKKQAADDTLNKIKAGEPFENFAALNEDPGATSSPDGYVFAKATGIKDESTLSALQQYGMTMVTEFETAAASLQPDQVSEVVESTYGYHIIKRVAIADGDYDKVKDSIKSILNNAKYLETIKTWEKNYKVKKYEKIISSLNIEEMKKIVEAKAKKSDDKTSTEEKTPDTDSKATGTDTNKDSGASNTSGDATQQDK